MGNIDLNAIKQEIDSRKKEKIHETTNPNLASNRDEFLGDLLNSLQTGSQGKAVNKLKVVEGRSKNVDVNGGGVINKNKPLDDSELMQHISHTPKPKNNSVNEQKTQVNPDQYFNNEDREKQMFNQFKNNGMSEQLKNMYNGKMINEYNTGMNQSKQGDQPMMPQGGVNQQLIQEQVQKQVMGFMNEHFSKLAEEALRNTIIEMYSQERVKKVMDEIMPEDRVKKIVVETIIELQNRKKNNQK